MVRPTNVTNGTAHLLLGDTGKEQAPRSIGQFKAVGVIFHLIGAYEKADVTPAVIYARLSADRREFISLQPE